MYSHAMNKPKFEELTGPICRYNYNPKQIFFDSMSIRAKVDANCIAHKLIEKGIDTTSIDLLQALSNETDHNQGDSIAYLKLNLYLRLKQNIKSENYFDSDFADKMKNLFETFFNVSGDYMKRITLK